MRELDLPFDQSIRKEIFVSGMKRTCHNVAQPHCSEGRGKKLQSYIFFFRTSSYIITEEYSLAFFSLFFLNKWGLAILWHVLNIMALLNLNVQKIREKMQSYILFSNILLHFIGDNTVSYLATLPNKKHDKKRKKDKKNMSSCPHPAPLNSKTLSKMTLYLESERETASWVHFLA